MEYGLSESCAPTPAINSRKGSRPSDRGPTLWQEYGSGQDIENIVDDGNGESSEYRELILT